MLVKDSYSFNSLLDDLTFKNVFSNSHLLKWFINNFMRYLNLRVRCYDSQVISQYYIKPHNKKYKLYYSDLVAILDNENIICLECYKNSFSVEECNKSLSYVCRIYANQLYNKNEKRSYKNVSKVIGINIMHGNYNRDSKNLVSKYKIQNNLSHKDLTNNGIEIYNINLDLLKEIPYTLDEDEFITILRIINAKTLNEMEYYVKKKGVREMNEVLEYVRRWNEESMEHNFEDYIQDRIRESNIEIREEDAKIMLKKNYPISDIQEITGLALSEIKSLQKKL